MRYGTSFSAKKNVATYHNIRLEVMDVASISSKCTLWKVISLSYVTFYSFTNIHRTFLYLGNVLFKDSPSGGSLVVYNDIVWRAVTMFSSTTTSLFVARWFSCTTHSTSAMVQARSLVRTSKDTTFKLSVLLIYLLKGRHLCIFVQLLYSPMKFCCTTNHKMNNCTLILPRAYFHSQEGTFWFGFLISHCNNVPARASI